VREVAARRVASARPWRAWSRRERHPGQVWARVVRALSSSSSTRAVLGGTREVRWRSMARWPGQRVKEERGRLSGWAAWPAWPCLALLLLSPRATMPHSWLEGTRGPIGS
jgi:hypothetical protein